MSAISNELPPTSLRPTLWLNRLLHDHHRRRQEERLRRDRGRYAHQVVLNPDATRRFNFACSNGRDGRRSTRRIATDTTSPFQRLPLPKGIFATGMSAFHGGVHRNVSMNAKLGDAPGVVGERLGYVYDFGSSTELIVSLSGSADGSFGNAVQLAARNEPPTWPCDRCRQPATMVCAQCVYEDKGFCCAEHAASHDCGEDMLLPVVNSPRMGVCGYTGED